jgi:cephalosporin-C deacetylase-like acetyl esterase
VRGYKGTPDLAAKGFITLQIGIHGIPVNLPDALYEQLNAGALESYNRYNLDNRDAYYYRRVYLAPLISASPSLVRGAGSAHARPSAPPPSR